MEAAKEDDRPSFIRLSTIIAWPAPNAQNTGASHGAALGDDEIAQTKKMLGFDPEEKFAVAPVVLDYTRKAAERGREAQREWDERFQRWRSANPEAAELFDRLQARELPEGLADTLPTFDADDLSLIHISEPTRPVCSSRMPSSA